MAIKIDTTTQRYRGSAQPEPDVLLFHTTEGMGWPGYAGGGQAPHDTVRAIPGKGIEVRRHYEYGHFSKALANTSLPGETNRRGVIQVELIGTCDPKYKGNKNWYYWPEADDVVLQALADYYRPIMKTYGIPLVAPTFKAYPSSYGNNGVRMTPKQFATWSGVCGHQHSPENDHGDPGNFPITKFLKMAGKTQKKKQSPHLIVKKGSKGRWVKHAQQLLGVSVDGDFGPKTDAAVRALQKKHNLTVDGKVGAATWKVLHDNAKKKEKK